MSKPTRKEVLERYRLIWDDLNSYEMTERLTFIRDAYLAQEEELERIRIFAKDSLAFIERLKAENQPLREKGKQLCCRVGALEMENQALKEALVDQRRSLEKESDDLRESLVKIQVAAKEEIDKLQTENQALKAQVAELSGYLMRLVNENADHQLEIHKLKNTLAANHIQMNSRQDELVPLDRSLEFGWHRYWLTRTYFEQAAKDANEMARLVQANIRELFEHDGMVGWDELPEWKYAQTIIDRYKNPMAVASGSGRRGSTMINWDEVRKESFND